MATIKVKQHDTARVVTDTLKTGDVAINLTGASVQFVMRKKDQSASAIRRAATIVSAVAGTVSYGFIAGDTAEAGVFIFEWEITFQNGDILSVPGDGYHILEILADIG